MTLEQISARITDLTTTAFNLYGIDLIGLTTTEKCLRSMAAFNTGTLPIFFPLEFRDLSIALADAMRAAGLVS